MEIFNSKMDFLKVVEKLKMGYFEIAIDHDKPMVIMHYSLNKKYLHLLCEDGKPEHYLIKPRMYLTVNEGYLNLVDGLSIIRLSRIEELLYLEINLSPENPFTFYNQNYVDNQCRKKFLKYYQMGYSKKEIKEASGLSTYRVKKYWGEVAE